MTKRNLNQNSKSIQKLIDIIEPDFIFSEKPLNRMKTINISENVDDKSKNLKNLKSLKNN